SDPRRGAPPQPRLRDRAPVVRHERVLHQSGPGAARALVEREEVREGRLYAPQATGRRGRATPPRQARGQTHPPHARAGGVHRRLGGRAVKAGTLPLLRGPGIGGQGPAKKIGSGTEVRGPQELAVTWQEKRCNGLRLLAGPWPPIPDPRATAPSLP